MALGGEERAGLSSAASGVGDKFAQNDINLARAEREREIMEVRPMKANAHRLRNPPDERTLLKQWFVQCACHFEMAQKLEIGLV